MADSITETMEKTEIVAIEPGRFRVVILNDDTTPMEFVIALLMKIFKHDQETSMALTMQIHNDGKAIAGVFTFEIAEQKSAEAVSVSRQSGFPLIIKIEAE
jgi:ATP-dependent Clp protease adaptor protein ClpS